jgi:hypothetical protein
MAGNALPLMLLVGGALVLTSKKKKKKSKPSATATAPGGSATPFKPGAPATAPAGPPVKEPPPAVEDPSIPYVDAYPSQVALEKSEAWNIANRPVQHYLTLLIGNFAGLSEDAKSALSEWADVNWDGWTLQIAPISKGDALHGEHAAGRAYRADAEVHLGLPVPLLNKDASTWEYSDVLDTLDVALGNLDAEALAEAKA